MPANATQRIFISGKFARVVHKCIPGKTNSQKTDSWQFWYKQKSV